MGRLVVIATGGTISSTPTEAGLAAALPGGAVLDALPSPQPVPVEVVDLCTVDSSALTLDQQLGLLRQVRATLADPQVRGIVVTHGTDTMEETAFLLDLHHDDPRPVVFTGSQRPLGDPGSDAPGNLADAFAVARQARGHGVLIAFGGKIHAARGTVKHHTLHPDAYQDPSAAPVGHLIGGEVLLQAPAPRPAALPLPTLTESPRVDILTHHTGGDAVLLRAAVAAGARGLVLVGAGAGNVNPEVVEAVRAATAAGVLVAVTSRTAAGPVLPIYTSATELTRAGAVLTGTLRAAQARIAVLSALLAGQPERLPELLDC
ncbi:MULTISPECIES: asparaginase [unclassified Crossiella]|uniref:asparaginase n=1 Tax=unclassified Crossiella TaxID=2620835 RepID=UPI001FFE9A89|nr:MULTISPECIES: asparaginase [unclassified Crossiella]MCK2243606.1 asparaginase [Crossiella sp. S99.2]MCK2257464.1 asparaginase [Crossiella sp. S99.1]